MSDFWARRKAAVAKEEQAEQIAHSAGELALADEALAKRSDEELLEEAKLPAPEDLDSADAVREFMSSALPQRLKTRALRQLWKLNPVLANLDGLVDYGEDFTDSATVIENLQTAYQVGKGMLSHLEAMTEQESSDKDEDLVVEDDPTLAAPIEDEALDVEHEDVLIGDVVAAQPATSEAFLETVDADLPSLAPSRRRMQFDFEMHA